MEFTVEFSGKSVYNRAIEIRKDSLGLADLDQARIKFGANVLAKDLAPNSPELRSNPKIDIMESLARESGHFSTVHYLTVFVDAAMFNKHVSSFFKEEEGIIKKRWTIHLEDIIEAWREAGFPTDWKDQPIAEPVKKEKPVKEEPKPDPLGEWADQYGSEFLKARKRNDFNWRGLARGEYGEYITKDWDFTKVDIGEGETLIDSPDQDLLIFYEKIRAKARDIDEVTLYETRLEEDDDEDSTVCQVNVTCPDGMAAWINFLYLPPQK